MLQIRQIRVKDIAKILQYIFSEKSSSIQISAEYLSAQRIFVDMCALEVGICARNLKISCEMYVFGCHVGTCDLKKKSVNARVTSFYRKRCTFSSYKGLVTSESFNISFNRPSSSVFSCTAALSKFPEKFSRPSNLFKNSE